MRTMKWVLSFVVCAMILMAASDASAQNKKVRIRNDTDVDIRAFVLSFDPNTRFVIDVAQGKQKVQDNVAPVPRGVLIFENFNDSVIASDKFEINPMGMNVEVRVTGDAANGYRIVFAAF